MVVPTYKDLPCLRVLLDLIEEERSQTITYLIVDNGSNDSEVSRALSASSKFWNSIQLTQNLGFGGG